LAIVGLASGDANKLIRVFSGQGFGNSQRRTPGRSRKLKLPDHFLEGKPLGVDLLGMKTFYRVTLFVFVIGLAILCGFAPWTSTPADSEVPHNTLGFAAVWSQQFASVPGARMDSGAFAIMGVVVAFFSVVIGGAAYFFRSKRGPEREDV
jgi:hypothetical protein